MHAACSLPVAWMVLTTASLLRRVTPSSYSIGARHPPPDDPLFCGGGDRIMLLAVQLLVDLLLAVESSPRWSTRAMEQSGSVLRQRGRQQQ